MGTYPDGAKISVGDSLVIHHRGYAGSVQNVIESKEELARWGLNEAGVMVDTSFGGLVFFTMAEICDGEICLVRRGDSSGMTAEAGIPMDPKQP